MKIWKLNNENKYECSQTITFQNSKSNCNILKLNNNEFVILSFEDKCLKFWNLNDYSNIATINNIQCYIDENMFLKKIIYYMLDVIQKHFI